MRYTRTFLAITPAILAASAGIANAQCDPDATFGNPAVLDNATGFGTSGEAEFADVTGDGNLDLLVGQSDVNLDADPDPAGIAMFPGDGAGGFGAPSIIGVEGSGDPAFTRSGPRSIVAADFNNDGSIDLAVGTLAIEVLINNGDGTFSDPFVFFDTGPGEGINDIDAADANNDGHIDIIATDTGGGLVVVAFNDGEGGFSDSDIDILPAARPVAAKAGDFDNDGNIDVAIGESQSTPRSVSVWLNNGSGSFSSAGNFTGLNGGPEDLDVGDFDNDGNLDVTVTNGNQGDGIDVLFGNGNGTLGSLVQVIIPGVDSAGGFPIALELDAGDIDNDGTDDIAVGVFGLSFDPNKLSRVGVALSNGDRTFRTGDAEAPSNVDRARRVDLGDLNGDGTLEAVLSGSSFSADTVAVFENLCDAGPSCPADLTGPDGNPDGVLDASDFFAYLDLFANGDLAADLTGPSGTPDGILDASDFFEFLDLFAAGCP